MKELIDLITRFVVAIELIAKNIIGNPSATAPHSTPATATEAPEEPKPAKKGRPAKTEEKPEEPKKEESAPVVSFEEVRDASKNYMNAEDGAHKAVRIKELNAILDKFRDNPNVTLSQIDKRHLPAILAEVQALASASETDEDGI